MIMHNHDNFHVISVKRLRRLNTRNFFLKTKLKRENQRWRVSRIFLVLVTRIIPRMCGGIVWVHIQHVRKIVCRE